MLKFPSLLFSLLVFTASLPLTNSAAQTQTTGAIQGRVYEVGTQTALPNVIVTVTNQDTGLVRSALTNGEGIYFLAMLPPGVYVVAGRRDDFEMIPDQALSNFPVRLAKSNLVQPPPLVMRRRSATPTTIAANPAAPPAAPSPQTPRAESPVERLVNTVNATRGANFNADYLNLLPLANTRSFDELALLAPGVAPAPQPIGNSVGPGLGSGVGTAGQFAVNGLRSRGNNFTVDGSDNNDEDIGVRRQGFLTLVPQAIESVQEFQIFTHLPEPQFGRNLGVQANAVSRSGGQKHHGAAYGFLTDRRLRARDFFDLTDGPNNFPLTRANDGAPILLDGRPLAPANPVGGENTFTRSLYGGVIGGPINPSTHFFASYEHQQVRAAKESNFAVPTVAERGIFGTGDTGFIRRRPGLPVQSLYPTSTNGDAFFSLFPFPNNSRGPYGANTFTEILPADADGSLASVKLERSARFLNSDHNFAARYNFTDDNSILPVTGEALFSSLRALTRTQNLALSLDTAGAGGKANQLRVSYGRTRLNFAEVRNGYLLKSKLLPNESFLLNAPLSLNATISRIENGVVIPARPAYVGIPSFTVEDVIGPLGQLLVSGYSPIGVNVFNFPQARVNNTFQFADTFIYSLKRHRLTLGGDFRRIQLNSLLDRNFRLLATFNGAPDVATQFGYAPLSPGGFYRGADFVATGSPTGFFQSLALTPDSTIGLRFWQQNFFFTDQIRARQNLTLTIGLRYEFNTVPTEVNRRIENTFASSEVRDFIAAEKRLTGGVSGFERFLAGRTNIFQSDANNLAPHIAFAWDPFDGGKFAVRGGYALYFDQIPGAVISQSRTVFPSFLNLNLAGLTDPSTPNSLNFFTFNPALNPVLIRRGTVNTYNRNFQPRGVVALLEWLNTLVPRVPGLPQTFPGGPGFVLPAADLASSYSQQWNLTVESQLGTNLLLSVGYVATRGSRLLRFATPNYGLNTIPIPVGARLDGASTTFEGFSASPGSNFRRTFPFLGSFTSIESDANSTYHSLQAQLTQRFARGLQFTTAYTWAHAIDEVSDLFDLAGSRTLPQNSFDRQAERGSANFDVRHRLAVAFTWDLPLPHRKIFADWQIAGIVALQSGQPFSFVASLDANLDGNLTDRIGTSTAVRRMNDGPQIYSFPADFNPFAVTGSASRNQFRAPAGYSFDLAVNKTFTLNPRHRLRLRAELFNLFNRPHFGVPILQLGFPALGRAVETRLPSRTLQLALKYLF